MIPVFLLSGCCRTPFDGKDSTYRVVTQVQIVYENGDMHGQRQFHREESIQVILEYLRHLDPYGRPYEDPETVQGRNYYISVIYSDGSQHLYHQRADRYLRIDGGPWKRIDSQKALYLSGLLGMMPREESQISQDVLFTP